MNATILLIDDDRTILDAVGAFLERIGYDIVLADLGETGLEEFDRVRPDLVLLDIDLPDLTGFEVLERLREQEASVVMLTGRGDAESAVEAMRLGAENFLTKPVDPPHLVVAVQRVLDKVRLRREVSLLRSRGTPKADLTALGESPIMVALAEQIALVAASERTTVLITGESGTGKGFVAQIIHESSSRAHASFVDVNCAGLTATFLDSELFGHEKGAFTDAKERKQGLFELADGGTLFLDEIGDLALELQPKLLKVLETTAFRRVGGTKEIKTDIRLIAATNRDMESDASAGRFRQDLFYRLNVLTLHMVPVRERPEEDIQRLIRRFFADVASSIPQAPGGISPKAMERLLAYSWPGNVREIRNVLERSIILAQGKAEVDTGHLPVDLRARRGQRRYVPVSLKDLERREIERSLLHHNGNRTRAARDLGISRWTLIKKVKEYDL